MKITETNLRGVILIQPGVFEDSRGYFAETYHESRYKENGIDLNFVQDNISVSKKGTLRGLHYQIPPKAQGKLCQVLKGAVLDVAVDIRFGSPTFGKHVIAELSDMNHTQIIIPTGFAHGFVVLSDEAVFNYKCSNYYSKEHERTIRFDDPNLKIRWGIENPIISEKDRSAGLFRDIEQDFKY